MGGAPSFSGSTWLHRRVRFFGSRFPYIAMQKSRQDNVAKQHKPELRIKNCGAIATIVANFCRVDFSSPGYGKPKLRRVWPIPITVLDARQFLPYQSRLQTPVGCHGRGLASDAGIEAAARFGVK